MKIDTIVDYYDLEKVKSPYDTIAMQQKQYFSAVHANLTNFLQSKLRSAIFEAPKKERNIQDAIEQLLIGRSLIKGIDYDRETGRVKVSIKESIPDFIFPKLDLALEIKFSNSNDKSRSIVDEINADIQIYFFNL